VARARGKARAAAGTARRAATRYACVHVAARPGQGRARVGTGRRVAVAQEPGGVREQGKDREKGGRGKEEGRKEREKKERRKEGKKRKKSLRKKKRKEKKRTEMGERKKERERERRVGAGRGGDHGRSATRAVFARCARKKNHAGANRGKRSRVSGAECNSDPVRVRVFTSDHFYELV
jgi:hypothetical protein